jgi:large subunit ribosomal protein L25
VLKAVNTGQFLSTIYELNVEGKGKTRVIPRDVQFDVVQDFPMHVDFLRVSKHAKIVVEVPVHFINEEKCVGLKRGGALNIVRHEIELSCPVTSIPDFLEADIEELDIGGSLHVSAIKLPDDVELTITDRDFTIASVAGHGSSDPEEGGEAEVAEEGGAEE